MAKRRRSEEEYAALSRAVEAGEYTLRGPVEFGSSLHEGRPIAEQPDQLPKRADPTAEEINAWLDTIEPNPADARAATGRDHFAGVGKLVLAAVTDNADEPELRAAVAAARAAGDSWGIIGLALGVSRQAAEERYGR